MGRLRESRWVFILLSILLAIVFWFYVRASVDPDGTTSVHNVRVEATGTNVLTSQGLTISGLSPQVVGPVVKTAGVAIVTRLSADFCKDAGEGGLASAVELAGTVLALAAVLPLMTAVVDTLTGLI